jgi:hypothetical protein
LHVLDKKKETTDEIIVLAIEKVACYGINNK